MAKSIGHLRSRVHEFFGNLGSLTSLQEQIDAMEDSGVAYYITGAALDFGLNRPDDETISKLFSKSALGRDGRINRQIAEFACWSRATALQEGPDSKGIALPYLIKRIEAFLDDRASDKLKTDHLLQRMDRAGLAAWEWFGNLEQGGVSHMGQLVDLSEDEAFDKYFPDDYKDIETIVRRTVRDQMHRNGLSFDYWRIEGRKIPAHKL